MKKMMQWRSQLPMMEMEMEMGNKDIKENTLTLTKSSAINVNYANECPQKEKAEETRQHPTTDGRSGFKRFQQFPISSGWTGDHK
jgi:hypothetical protein